ncbi:uncharacterized protein LOC120351056 [Nilaparvata lugens]|uniref:uncharacterized protein LOC120351056 n=1 Tax=Nilaparvata lugens TaxID=108931 RepID=UPI00193DE68F|nr:uncharacterized protein LOC120351056 [Nilaparvata lugens]
MSRNIHLFRGGRRKKDRIKVTTGLFTELESAFNNALKTYYYKNDKYKDICKLLIGIKLKIINLLSLILNQHQCLKFNVLVECTYKKKSISHDFDYQDRTFKTKNITIVKSSNLENVLQYVLKKICHEEYIYEGWSLSKIDGVLIRVNKYKPLRGRSYIPLPKKIQNKRAIINCKNIDNKCFMWAILSDYVQFHPERISYHHRNLISKFNFKGISLPTPIRDIKVFEKNNKSISINVNSLDEKYEIFPLKICDYEKRKHFDLLLLQQDGEYHYCLIKNLSRLIRSQLSKHENKITICKRCFSYFDVRVKKNFKTHQRLFSKKKITKVIMPKKNICDNINPILKFKNYQNKFRVSIVLYADFECLLVPYLSCTPSSSKSFSNKTQSHQPYSFCTYLVIDEEIPEKIKSKLPSEPYLYRGENVANNFMQYITNLTNTIGKLLKENISMTFTKKDLLNFRKQKCCEMCDCQFTMMNKAVRDHCHITGKYRAALCNRCNLLRQNQKYIPVYLHNGANYDNHLIIRELGIDEHNIDIIPNSSEKYISFTKHTSSKLTIRFIDTLKFMNTSLDKLVKNLPKEEFHHIKKIFPQMNLDLVTCKGVFPYEYLDDEEKLNEKKLPSISKFYSSLNKKHITYQDYIHAHKVWQSFKIQTLGEYSDLYLKLDVILLLYA